MEKWIGNIMGTKMVYSSFISLVNINRPFLSYSNLAMYPSPLCSCLLVDGSKQAAQPNFYCSQIVNFIYFDLCI